MWTHARVRLIEWMGEVGSNVETVDRQSIEHIHLRQERNKLCRRPPQYASPPANWPLTSWHWNWCQSHVWCGLLCANFSLPRPLCSRLRPDVRERQTDVGRQTDVRRASSLNAPYPMGGGITSLIRWSCSLGYDASHSQNLPNNCRLRKFHQNPVTGRSRSWS